MRKINKLGKRAAALVLAVGLTLSTAAPVLAADADEVQTPAAQTEQQETDTEADEADALPELSEDREVAEEDEAAALPELSEDREVAEEDEAAALPELSEDREVAEEDEAAALPELSEDRAVAGADEDWPVDEYAARASHKHKYTKKGNTVAPTCTTQGYTVYQCEGYDEIKFSIKKGFYTVHHDCSETTKEDYTDMLPHTKGEEVTEKRVEPTCTEAGSATYICKVCKQEFTETLKALGHTKGEELTEKTCGAHLHGRGFCNLYLQCLRKKNLRYRWRKSPTPGATIKMTTSPAVRNRRNPSTARSAVPAIRNPAISAMRCGKTTNSPTMKRQMV